MRRRIECIRRRCGLPARIMAAVMAACLVVGMAVSLGTLLDVVTITDADGTRHTVLTASRHPEEILQQAGLAAGENDKVVYTAVSQTTAEIEILRAFPVALVADGQTLTAEFAEGTVGDLLEATGVQLGPEDIVEPAPETALSAGLMARIKRVHYVEEVRRETLEPEAVAAYKAALGPGAAFVESYNSIYDVTYRDRLVDGRVVSSEIVELVPLIQPRPADSYTITAGVPCSRIEGYDDISFGPDGKPENYTRVMSEAICTAYSSNGGKGASGLGLYCGTVAVNPNVIPYGTRMFITSADGSFIYGFAIATDTGVALMDGRIDIDLYFETNAECLQFGKRTLEVYILD